MALNCMYCDKLTEPLDSEGLCVLPICSACHFAFIETLGWALDLIPWRIIPEKGDGNDG